MGDEKSYAYDVFISYRWVSPDQEWVREELYPALTAAGLRVCLDVEDFSLGHHIIHEMTRAGEASRHVLCVVSPAYIEANRMAEFEWLMAAQSDPGARDSRLIPLILRPTNLPPAISGRLAADWTNPRHHAREWRRLLRALGKPGSDAPPPTPLPPVETPPGPEPGGAVDEGRAVVAGEEEDDAAAGTRGQPGPDAGDRGDEEEVRRGGRQEEEERKDGQPFPYRYVLLAAAAVVLCLAGVAAYNSYLNGPHTLDGFIHEADGSRLPVNGATVRVPGSELQTLTDGQGRFVFEGVPGGRRVKTLTVDYAGRPLPPFGLNAERRYYVFPTPTPTPFPAPAYIEQHEWSPASSAQPCEAAEEEEPYADVRRYELRDKRISQPPGAKEFVLTFESLDEDEVFNTEIVRPPGARTSTVRDDEKRRPGNRAERWVLKVPEQGGELQVKLDLCLGSRAGRPAPSIEGLETVYIFR